MMAYCRDAVTDDVLDVSGQVHVLLYAQYLRPIVHPVLQVVLESSR